MMLLRVFLLICSAVFAIAVPTKENILSSEHKTSSGTEDESQKVTSGNISDLFFQTPGNKFYVSRVAKPWDDAATTCKDVGMDLASITSQQEQLELFKFLYVNDLVPKDDFSGYWLSGHQLESGLYSWTALNTHINCWGWLPGEPSHIDDSEHCMELKFDANLVRLGWNNLICENNRQFICQKKLVNKEDKSLFQQGEQHPETSVEQQTSCYWFYNPRKPIRISGSQYFPRFG